MTCSDFCEIVPLLINQSLEQEMEKEALQHLMGCESCRQELAFWTQIATAQAKERLPGFTKERILKAVRDDQLSALRLTGKAVGLYFKIIKSII